MADLAIDDLFAGLPGICYTVDSAGVILRIANPMAWHYFALANDASEIANWNRLLGRSLFDFIEGEAKKLYRQLLDSLVRRPRQVQVGYRCDSPEERRDHILLLSVLKGGIVLCQNIALEVSHRPRMGIFDVRATREGPLVAICSYCKAVRSNQQWFTPEAYYAQGGPSQVNVTHGVCPPCLQKMMVLVREES